MDLRRGNVRGFTLVELMVTLAVVGILVMLAVPSFTDFRHRSAIRGAGEQALSLWNQARFEAVKRNSRVKFGVMTDVAGNFCMGVATTTTDADATPCDCLTSATSCNIARYPADQGEWRQVTLSGTPTLGQNTSVVVIDPKFTTLTEAADAGAITLADPAGNLEYKLNLRIDAMGRGYLCESTASTGHMAEYTSRTCTP